MAAVTRVETVFPLHHHAEVLVVEDDGFGGDFLDVGGGQLLDVHEERAVAVDVHDLFMRERHFGSQSSREAVTHGAEAGAGEELAGVFELVELTGPHLVLAHAGGDDGFATGEFIEHLDGHLREDDFAFFAGQVVVHVLGLEHFFGDRIAERGLGLPGRDLIVPGGEPLLQRAVRGAYRSAGQERISRR